VPALELELVLLGQHVNKDLLNYIELKYFISFFLVLDWTFSYMPIQTDPRIGLEICSACSKQLFYLKDILLHIACLEEDRFFVAENFRLSFDPLKYYNSIHGIILFKMYIYYNYYTIG
jgi:hypothetical protein